MDIKPFSNGSEYRYWRSNNCDKCTKDVVVTPEGAYITRCDIEGALSMGAIIGTIPKELHNRMGTGLRCKEFEPESEE